MRRLAVASFLVGAIVSPASAYDRTWTGSASKLWSNPANWGGIPPVDGGSLVFPLGASNTTNTNDLAPGRLFLSLTFSANYTIGGNAIQLGPGGILAPNSVVTIQMPITIAASQQWVNSDRFDSIVATSTVNLNGRTLTFNPLSSGGMVVQGVLTGSGSLVKTGVGNVFLYSPSTTANLTVNSGGINILRGSIGNVTASTGLVALVSSSAGTITFAGGPATLNFGDVIYVFPSPTGSLTLPAGNTYLVRLPAGATIIEDVTGTVSLGNPTLSLVPYGNYAVGTVVTLINNDGSDPVSGTFNGLPEGSTVTASGQTFRISYVGGTGNDVTIKVVSSPFSPTTTALTSTPNPSLTGQTVTFTATVTSSSGTPTGWIDFYDDTTRFATGILIGSGQATATKVFSTAGAHMIRAIYRSDIPFASSTAIVPQVVVAPPFPLFGQGALALLALAFGALTVVALRR